MKSLKAFQPLAVDELPLSLNIEGCCIKIRKLMLYKWYIQYHWFTSLP